MNVDVRKDYMKHGVIRHAVSIDCFKDSKIEKAYIMSLSEDTIDMCLPCEDGYSNYFFGFLHKRGWYYDKNAFSWFMKINKEANELEVYTIPKHIIKKHGIIRHNSIDHIYDDMMYYVYRSSAIFYFDLKQSYRHVKHSKLYSMNLSMLENQRKKSKLGVK